ncbi:MAG: hypothetical protein HYY85_22285 [Deltaproteobacteria bacterium]|nr:hypothetical protein [Deltaproteobacteria bacterium]
MPQKEIPCSDCEKEKERIEEAGDQIVISCDPIPGKPRWCLIVWRRK